MPMRDSSTEKEIFHAAHALADDAARSGFLDVACQNDGALRSRIESLLRAADVGGGFMRRQAVDSIAAEFEEGHTAGSLLETPPLGSNDAGLLQRKAASLAGLTLGHYHVLSLIGSGGMGQVYLAEDPRLSRNVALKVFAVGRIGEGRSHSIRESRASSALDHPNVCPIHDVGEDAGWCFIAMQYVEGQTLAELMGGRQLGLDTLLSIALQVADALSAAHENGVIHCDIKPRNIIVTPRGQAKVLDFGLAKLLAPISETTRAAGIVGTPAYMSPEQARGGAVDHRSDLFSFGAVLYQMATGQVPFRGESSADVMQAVIAEPHTPPREANPEIPPELAAVIDRALAKSREERYQSVEQLASDLRSIQTRFSLPARRESASRRRRRWLTAATLTASLAAALGWLAVGSVNRSWARKQLPKIERLVQEGRTLEAYSLAVRVREIRPGEPKLTRLMRVISDTLSVNSDPPGARVYLKRFEGPSAGAASPRTYVGTTPLSELEVAGGDYLVSIEKVGYAPRQRTWSTGVVLDVKAPTVFEALPIEVKLTSERDLPPGMVFVPGGEYYLQAWRRPVDTRVNLDAYFIDQCEVTNRQYKEFVEAGGYLDERYWSVPFVESGRTLSREEAMGKLTDRTGKPGPRGWSEQWYPEGKADHPVTGVSWYEAAAYAAFRNKSLPTVFQWERAARDGEQLPYRRVFSNMPWGPVIGPTDGRANFYSRGTVPVGSLEFGMSPFGCYEMAGNVAEWCANPTTPEGYLVSGGSWASVAYEFGFYGPHPGFDASDKLGFRCVKNHPRTGDQGAMLLRFDEVPHYTPDPEGKVRAHFPRYDYVRTSLKEWVVDVVEADRWLREEVEYLGADNKPRRAYLYRPKGVPEPVQVIHFVPAGDVFRRTRSLTQSIEADYTALVDSGRAVFAIQQPEFIGGEGPLVSDWPDADTAEYVDYLASKIIDMRRGLDYLETRSDVDTSRIAFFKPSAGGFLIAYLAVEDRYRAVVLQGAGIRSADVGTHKAANPIDFAPLIRAEKLLVQGRHDEAILFSTEAKPLFNLLSDPKKLFPYDGGHRPSPEDLERIVNTWLNETLGPVAPSRARK